MPKAMPIIPRRLQMVSRASWRRHRHRCRPGFCRHRLGALPGGRVPGPASSRGLCSALLGPPGLTRASPGASPGPALVLSGEEPQPAWLTEEKDRH